MCHQFLPAMAFAPLVTRSRRGLHDACRECEAIMAARADRLQGKVWMLMDQQHYKLSNH